METAKHSNASISYSPKKCRQIFDGRSPGLASFSNSLPVQSVHSGNELSSAITVAGTATDLHRTSLLNYM